MWTATATAIRPQYHSSRERQRAVPAALGAGVDVRPDPGAHVHGFLLFVPTSRTEETPLPPLTVAVGSRDTETGRVPVTLTRTVDGARVEERLELWTDGGLE